MKRLRAIFMLVCCSMILFSALPNVPYAMATSQEFSDVPPTHWAYQSIQRAVSDGIINGYSDGTFRPNQAINEAEFIKLLVAIIDKKTYSAKDYDFWYVPYIDHLAKLGWHNADGNSAYFTARDFTRGKAALYLSMALGIRADSLYKAVEVLYEKDVSNGNTSQTYKGFGVDNSLTRAEAVTFLYRTIEKYPKLSLLNNDNIQVAYSKGVKKLDEQALTMAISKKFGELYTWDELTHANHNKPFELGTDLSYYTMTEGGLIFIKSADKEGVSFSISLDFEARQGSHKFIIKNMLENFDVYVEQSLVVTAESIISLVEKGWNDKKADRPEGYSSQYKLEDGTNIEVWVGEGFETEYSRTVKLTYYAKSDLRSKYLK